MKDWFLGVLRYKRNFTCVYSSKNNTIYSVPRTPNNVIHVILTIFFTLLFLGLAGVLKTLANNALNALISGTDYPWWATALDSTVGALSLIVLFLIVAPRLGMFPGINGFSLQLDEKSPKDKKLGQLIKNNPKALNIDWMRDWYEAKTSVQEEMLQEMKNQLKKA